ncbi:MAG: helix-turn-helix transcriptional regulator [Bacilli bacterium]|nr:helix-turn-helix transcriptional regulator [Bacilli bacterium]
MQHKPETKRNIYIIISQNIKKYRRLQKITQKELAKKCGYSYAYIRRIEGPNCPKNFSILTICNICDALNIEVSSIFENNDI